MATRTAERVLGRGWLYIPAASSPIGGGMIKIGGGSTWAAVTVGTAPYAIFFLLCLVFVSGYLAAVTRYLWSKADGQEAMERLILVSANAVVSILTLTRAPLTGDVGSRVAVPPPARDAASGTRRQRI